MIYIILDVVIENDDITNIQSRPIIKIGFTNNWRSRRSAYINHGPGIKVLRTIKGGTELQERALHQKFKHLKYKNFGNEWFEYDKEMIDYLMSVDLGDLEVNKSRYSLTTEMKRYLEISYEVCLRDVLGEDNFERDSIKSDDLKLRFDDINQTYSTYVKSPFSRNESSRLNMKVEDIHRIFKLEQRKDLINQIEFIYKGDFSKHGDNVNAFMKEFNKNRLFSRRMKLLCEEIPKLTEIEVKSIFREVPVEYYRYYITLGPEKLKALGYASNTVKRTYEKRNFKKREDNVNLLDELFYNEFKEGDKLSLVDIKEKVKVIYDKINCPNTPKATVLKDFFKVKEMLMTRSTSNRRVKAYKLIKRLR